MRKFSESDLSKLVEKKPGSHKGQNGRLLVIGGSKLFHASIFWSADVASRFVDLVHFTSPTEENADLVRVRSKERFWNGIVVPFGDVEAYAEEDDCILIGPGMPREEGLFEGELPTKEVVENLIQKFPTKKWVVDGGALQEMNENWITDSMILTPHAGEFGRLFKTESSVEEARKKALQYGCTILLKGKSDFVCDRRGCVEVVGGNEGLTKGGTGDVLAGMVAALYCSNEAFLAASAGSYLLNKAADVLYQKVGSNYSTTQLVDEMPKVLRDAT